MRTSSLFLHLALAGTLFINSSSLEAQTQRASAIGTSTQVFTLPDSGISIDYPPGWSPNRYANVNELLNVPPEKLSTLGPDDRETVASIDISVIPLKSHAQAVSRLRNIAAESNATSSYLTVGGWPALQRREGVAKPRRGVNGAVSADAKMTIVTVAVAANELLVRFSGYAPGDTSGQLADQMQRIALTMRFRAAGDPATTREDLQKLRASPALTSAAPVVSQSFSSQMATNRSVARAKAASVSSDPSDPSPPDEEDDDGLINLQIFSEPEISVSTNGQNIVVAQQCTFESSNNSGTTFPFGGGATGVNCTGGDSSLAFGKSGNFYWATIGSSGCPAASPRCNNVQQVSQSTNNGQTFAFVTNVIDCRVTAGCGFGNVPDQEHIGADRFNSSGTNQDQVYMVFRKGFGYGMSCSTDGGSNWTAVAFHTGGSIDFPRITVGQDGTVYVITRNGGSINLDSYSSCNSGLVQNHNQTPVATFTAVACPVPGLDRCNNGNVLSSPTIAVDDKNANHLYVAYATNTAANNENIMVLDSPDGGTTWNTAVQVNAAVNGRRYMPWVCSVEGKALVSWFDRRNATAANNDLTDFFGGSASVVAGNLTAGADFVISTAADPQCASGWACVPRTTADSESCSVQPQLAGVCCNPGHAGCPGSCPGGGCPDSGQRCDFTSGPACPNAGETCNPNPNGGCPKYGDYNGNTCQFGRFYTIWPSATNQPGAIQGTSGNIDLFYSSQIVHAPPTAKCKDVTVSAGSTCTASASIDNGSNDPDSEAVTLAQNPPGPYALGDTTVTLTVTDTLSVSATCTAKVTVVDNTPPVATCPAGTTASADATCHAGVPDVLAGVTITDNCPGPFSKSQTPAAGTPETLGTTTITVNVKDASGNPASCTTTFKVVDTTPPVVTSSVATSQLWPPNHDLQNVGLAASATDNCTPNPVIAVKGIFSTESDQGPDADSNFSPDAKNIGVGTLRLRSERPGSGQRVYLNVVQATDASGNVGYSCTTDFVPQSQSAADIASVQTAAAAALAYCSANNGAAPPGFVPVGVGPLVGPKQ